jgi:hypothetical protein
MQKIMETEQLSGISALHQQKKTIRDWRASKEELKKKKGKNKSANRGLNAKWPKLEDNVLKWTIFRDFKCQFGFKN